LSYLHEGQDKLFRYRHQRTHSSQVFNSRLREMDGVIMKWFKKEPVPAPEMKVEDFLTKVYELYPDRKYVLWFERMINPAHVEILRKHMASVIGEGNVTFIAGISAPEIYEFEGDKVQMCTRPLPHICKVNGPCNGWPREEKL
jgi:hypothetical protein